MRFLLAALALALPLAAWGQPEKLPEDRPTAVPDKLYTPASAVYAALADARALQKAGKDPRHYRYLSAYTLQAEKDLAVAWRLSSYVSNHLNVRKRAIALPAALDEGRLLRIDIATLGIDPKAWDLLGDKGSGDAPYPEPYFHQELEVVGQAEKAVKKKRVVTKTIPPGGQYGGATYPQGGSYQVEEEYEEKVPGEAQRRIVLAFGPGLPKAEILELVALCDTQHPVYRWDWFVSYAMQPPAYHAFLGDPKDLRDFQKLAGFDPKSAGDEGVQLRGAALFSEVASRNRALERNPTPLNYGRGYFLQSFDFFTSIRQNDLLKNLSQGRRDAGELIWALPNGLQGYGLINGEEKRIDFADPRVATDNRTYMHNKVVGNGWKCAFCHARGTIRVEDEVRLSGKELLGVLTDGKTAAFVQDRYFGANLNDLLQGDAEQFSAAVKAACGGADAAAVALEFQEAAWRYLERKMSIEDVCVEQGYPPDAVKPVIEEAGRYGLDHTFVRLLRARKGRRDQYETAHQQLQGILTKLPPRDKP